MAALPISILAIFLALSSFQLSAAEAEAPGPSGPIGHGPLGGWKPIDDLTSPNVMRIAEFAVKQHNRDVFGYNLILLRIVKGEAQLVNGWNYRLVIRARTVSQFRLVQADYEAFVHSSFDGKALKLVSFEKL